MRPFASLSVSLVSLVSFVSLAACSSSDAPIGANSAADSDGGVVDSKECQGLAIPEIACASGSTNPVCKIENGKPAWSITCESAMDAGSACDGLGVPALACASGPTTPVCTTVNGKPEWTITCEGADGGGCEGPAYRCFHCIGSPLSTCEKGTWTCPAPNPGMCTPTPLTAGVYGGKDIQVTVAADGSAQYRFDCGAGSSDAIVPDATGKFTVQGTFQGGGGASQADGGPPPGPAVYNGTVSGSAITFTVTPSGGTAGTPFTATLGTKATLFLCQ